MGNWQTLPRRRRSSYHPDSVTAALGKRDDLLAVKLDVTVPGDAEAAVQAAVERFGPT